MRRLLIVILALFFATTAHAQTGGVKTLSQLNTEIGSPSCSQPTCLWPDNTTGLILPFDLRQIGLDIAATVFDPATAKSIATPAIFYVTVTGVNFNSATTDTAVPIVLPLGMTRFQINTVNISNASHSLTGATAGLFSTTGGGGVAIAADQSLTVSATTDATANNSQSMTLTNNTITSFVLSGLAHTPNFYFRVGTAEGSAATADVTLAIRPLP